VHPTPLVTTYDPWPRPFQNALSTMPVSLNLLLLTKILTTSSLALQPLRPELCCNNPYPSTIPFPPLPLTTVAWTSTCDTSTRLSLSQSSRLHLLKTFIFTWHCLIAWYLARVRYKKACTYFSRISTFICPSFATLYDSTLYHSPLIYI
jgi:hypothetical protein